MLVRTSLLHLLHTLITISSYALIMYNVRVFVYSDNEFGIIFLQFFQH